MLVGITEDKMAVTPRTFIVHNWQKGGQRPGVSFGLPLQFTPGREATELGLSLYPACLYSSLPTDLVKTQM